ncbi:hypothetical protein BDV11DRAFT_179701 [Aspergillus similis]
MAEALGTASGVAGIISLGLEITQGLLKFYAAWGNQDAEIDSMYNALRAQWGACRACWPRFSARFNHRPHSTSKLREMWKSVLQLLFLT